LLSRIVIETVVNKDDRLITRINKAVNIPIYTTEGRQDKRHYLLVKRGYVVFYSLFFVMVITGLIMSFDHTDFLKWISRPARSIHSFVQYLIYAYILTHIVGVVRADMKKQKGIVSAMINGGINDPRLPH
jgi:Ni/Fe-hydrogenase 1 B-type cytochrome subunit